MTPRRHDAPWVSPQAALFVLLQVGVMLVAISNESLWIDEFWTAYFAELPSFKSFFDLLVVPSGSQTPLHFLHFYLWEQWVPRGEFLLRLANLPVFVLGQWALFMALRAYPAKLRVMVLVIGALHPMVWQYANEARPYILMFAGAQMMLAYLLHLHAPAGPAGRSVFVAYFVVGGIFLVGASLLGTFWVFAACLYGLLHHHRHSTWRGLLRGVNLLLVGVFLAVTAVLTAYYVRSLLQGAGASRLDSSTPATVVFAAYEVLGLAGLGPSRLDLRAAGAAALGPYLAMLVVAAGVLVFVLAVGIKQARARLGTRDMLIVSALGLFPVVVVLFSGFAMHWRVLGRHLTPALPLLILLLALALTSLLERGGHRGQRLRWLLAVAGLLLLFTSSLSLRFSDQHRKDDYRGAAALAQQALAQGQRVWWAADAVGANHYGLPGEFDFIGEMTGVHQAVECVDRPGVQSVANLPGDCLRRLSPPDLIILSKPDGYDKTGGLADYLKAKGYALTQSLPAFTLWRKPG
jgi:hypothetical protein